MIAGKMVQMPFREYGRQAISVDYTVSWQVLQRLHMNKETYHPSFFYLAGDCQPPGRGKQTEVLVAVRILPHLWRAKICELGLDNYFQGFGFRLANVWQMSAFARQFRGSWPKINQGRRLLVGQRIFVMPEIRDTLPGLSNLNYFPGVHVDEKGDILFSEYLVGDSQIRMLGGWHMLNFLLQSV